MIKKSFLFIAVSSFQSIYRFAKDQPQRFWSNIRSHIWILLPLIGTQLLQKLQDLVDDRLMNKLGATALTIHNVQYSLYGLAQEIGLIAATSLLIFWKRKETEGKQRTVFSLHVGLTLTLAGIICFFTYHNTLAICEHFAVQKEYVGTAQLYLQVGLLNLALRSLYVPVNTILIACHQRAKCIGSIFFICSAKVLTALVLVMGVWDGQAGVESITQPMLIYAVSSIFIVGLPMAYMIIQVLKQGDAWGRFDFKHALKVWPGEIGIGLVSAVCPLLFSFQIAKANTAPGFFVTYQIALHLTCLLTLPVLAGAQVAVRDASAEQSGSGTQGMAFKPLHQSLWWPKFFYASLVPSVFCLTLTALFPVQIIQWIYGYEVPRAHIPFLPIFFIAWILFQFGTVFVIMLRAAQRNGLATRNIIVSGIVVQLGFTQILLKLEACTSLGVGLVMVSSCTTFLILNWLSVAIMHARHEKLTMDLVATRLRSLKGRLKTKRAMIERQRRSGVMSTPNIPGDDSLSRQSAAEVSMSLASQTEQYPNARTMHQSE